MYKFQIRYTFHVIFMIAASLYIISLTVLIALVLSNGIKMKSELGATKMKIERVNVYDKYGSKFGSLGSIRDSITGNSTASSIADDMYSYFVYYDSDGLDAIKTKEQFTEYYRMNLKNADILTLAFLFSGFEVFIAFAALCYGVFMDREKLWFLISMIASIIIACFILSDIYLLIIIGYVLIISSIVMTALDVKKIRHENYLLSHRNDKNTTNQDS